MHSRTLISSSGEDAVGVEVCSTRGEMGDLLTELSRTSRKGATRADRRASEMRSRSFVVKYSACPHGYSACGFRKPWGVMSPIGLDYLDPLIII